jgi:hypothetical protein
MRFVLLLIFTTSAFAQSLIHSPIDATALPQAGRGMVLAVQVVGSRSPDLDIRALVFRDGIPLDVKLRAKTFDKSDRIVYSATIPSPKTQIRYTFALTKGEQVIKTDEYRITRECEARAELAPWDGTVAEPSREEGMLPVLTQARALERDIEQYEFVLKQILALKEAFSK